MRPGLPLCVCEAIALLFMALIAINHVFLRCGETVLVVEGGEAEEGEGGRRGEEKMTVDGPVLHREDGEEGSAGSSIGSCSLSLSPSHL